MSIDCLKKSKLYILCITIFTKEMHVSKDERLIRTCPSHRIAGNAIGNFILWFTSAYVTGICTCASIRLFFVVYWLRCLRLCLEILCHSTMFISCCCLLSQIPSLMIRLGKFSSAVKSKSAVVKERMINYIKNEQQPAERSVNNIALF